MRLKVVIKKNAMAPFAMAPEVPGHKLWWVNVYKDRKEYIYEVDND